MIKRDCMHGVYCSIMGTGGLWGCRLPCVYFCTVKPRAWDLIDAGCMLGQGCPFFRQLFYRFGKHSSLSGAEGMVMPLG